MKTNIPKIEITPQGLKIPSELEVLDGVLKDFNAAFGGNLNLNLETPQGQLASSIAAIITDNYHVLAELVNQVNPDYADGAMQDAIAKIYFLERKPATDSTVMCEFMGLAGTTIPKGFVVRDVSGNDWILQESVGIGESGKVEGRLTFSGSLNAPAHTVNQMVQTIVGLDRVTNPQDAIAGRNIESRAEFRQRRQKSVAINAHGTPQAVYANVFNLDGVQDVYVIDNPQGETVTVGASNTELKPHSIFVAVVGGKDEEIAETILKYAGNGCDFNGNKTVTVEDKNYTAPRPSYEVSFCRPRPLNIYFRITTESDTSPLLQMQIKQAVVDAFQRDEKAKIGSNIYAMPYVNKLMTAIPNATILDVQVGLSAQKIGNVAKVGIDQTPTIALANVEVLNA